MKTTSHLCPLKTELHDFDSEQFGCVEDLQHLTPTDDGWSAMMVACSECGFSPDQTSLFGDGELFIVQNFGNVVLPENSRSTSTQVIRLSGELGLRDIIVCGHMRCQTVSHFVSGDPGIQWLQHGNGLRHLMHRHYSHLHSGQCREVAVQENVLMQLEKVVDDIGDSTPDLRVHGWILDSESARVFSFNPECGQFE